MNCLVLSGWPRQPSVTEYQVKLWDKYLRTHFVTDEGLHFRQSLGKWTSDSNLEWRYTQSPTNALFDTILRLQAVPVRSACSTRSQGYTIWCCVAPRATYHHLLDSGYSQLPVSTNIYVPRHDGADSAANSHPSLVRGSLAASVT